MAAREAVRIYSRSHFVLSVLVGVGAAIWLGAGPVAGVALVAYAAAVGVLVDLDHFVIARLSAGSWRAARYCLRRPAAVLFDQESIFRPDEVGPLQRLLSHALLGGALVLALAPIRPALAALTAVVLYVHVVGDLIADVREQDVPIGAPDGPSG